MDHKFVPLSEDETNVSRAARRDSGFKTAGMWFGPADRPLAGWWTSPARPSRDGVVIASPLGYEYWSAHRSLRTLAEALAQSGWNVLRFDWDGTGDSAGNADDPGRVTAWCASLAHAVAAMRDAGMQRIALIGLRPGATLALLEAATLGVENVVACAPVAGRRFFKELKLLGIPDPEHPGGVMYSGLVVDPDTAADLAAIDPERNAAPAAIRTLIVTGSATADAKLLACQRADGRALDVGECPQMPKMLQVAAGDDEMPDGFVDTITNWLGNARLAPRPAVLPARATIDLPWHDGRVRETFMRIDGFVAVRSAPPDKKPDTVVVFLNSGSESHIGPARAWVEYARALALRGYACMRTDFSGWGESPDEGHARGRAYDAHCVADTLRIVAALRGDYARIVLVGLCASAWVALKAALEIRVEGVFALNPQMYWQPGDQADTLIADTHRRRTPQRRREAVGARLGWWSLLDLVGVRPMASRWLSALHARRTPVMLCFAEGDDGLTFLRDRCGRRLVHELRSDYLTVEELAGIDHEMYRLWRRPAVVKRMLGFLERLPAA